MSQACNTTNYNHTLIHNNNELNQGKNRQNIDLNQPAIYSAEEDIAYNMTSNNHCKFIRCKRSKYNI